MKRGCLIGLIVALVVVVIFALSMFVTVKNYYNSFIALEENVNQAWAQVENVYQRRADLIPNLVEVVKGYASHERETLQAVVEARSKVGGQINIGPEVLNNPQAFARFQQAQDALSSALQRLMVVVERYPNLKADQRFADLQAQLEGTENRIAVERRRFNEAVQAYNTAIRKFPANIIASMFGFQPKVYFKAQVGADKVPEVKF
ncbi:LemA family protein [Caldithrix abyssi DSM 13497]|uniref:LemA family protein n=1 Tax=Caldithrix abyssi DSM 13497 TaxID=880073 RepID=H1XUR0_CALAY|nr:LemA family protein [Caldithrix abyssi]APF17512.1 LemA protein [Caldithrix abyssi DSM 13497]EHO41609.1 LemA family protein [Caldithrix abyssi DSM 13497]